MTLTAAQKPTADDVIAWILEALPSFDQSARLTPQTVLDQMPAAGWTRASNALHSLAASGFLFQTHKAGIYALRPDLPTTGDGHVWTRYSTRGGAVVEVVASQPAPTPIQERLDGRTSWLCTGCPETYDTSRFQAVDRLAKEHAQSCYGLPLT